MKPLDREGRSELRYAARDGELAAVQKLVAADFDVNHRPIVIECVGRGVIKFVRDDFFGDAAKRDLQKSQKRRA
jgi:hypothetical protein